VLDTLDCESASSQAARVTTSSNFSCSTLDGRPDYPPIPKSPIVNFAGISRRSASLSANIPLGLSLVGWHKSPLQQSSTRTSLVTLGWSGIEATTLTLLKVCRTTIVEPIVRAHRGHVVKMMGDGSS